MYTVKIYKNEELVEQQECNTAEALLEVIEMANKVYNGAHYEIWRDETVLVDKGLLDF